MPITAWICRRCSSGGGGPPGRGPPGGVLADPELGHQRLKLRCRRREDTPNRLARAYDLTPEPGMSEEFDFRSHAGEVVVGPFVIEAHPVVHPVDAFALRITVAGRVLVYSGDTGPCQALDDAARDADLLLAEASFCEGVENPPEIHLTGADCGRTAATAQVGRLVLTHIPPWHDKEQALREARSVWDGQVDLASAGATYQV